MDKKEIKNAIKNMKKTIHDILGKHAKLVNVKHIEDEGYATYVKGELYSNYLTEKEAVEEVKTLSDGILTGIQFIQDTDYHNFPSNVKKKAIKKAIKKRNITPETADGILTIRMNLDKLPKEFAEFQKFIETKDDNADSLHSVGSLIHFLCEDETPEAKAKTLYAGDVIASALMETCDEWDDAILLSASHYHEFEDAVIASAEYVRQDFLPKLSL